MPLIPHDTALIMLRTDPKPGRRWVRPAVLERMRKQQARNVEAMHRLHRANQLADAVEVCIDVLGAEVIERDTAAR